MKNEKRKIKLSETNWLVDYNISSSDFEKFMMPRLIEATTYYSGDRKRKFEESFLTLVDYLIFSYRRGTIENLDLISDTIFPNKDKYSELLYDTESDYTISPSDIDWDDIMDTVRNGPFTHPFSDAFVPSRDRGPAQVTTSDGMYQDLYKLLDEEKKQQEEPIEEDDTSEEVIEEDNTSCEEPNQPEDNKTGSGNELQPVIDIEEERKPVKCPTGIVKEEAIEAGVKWISCDIVPPDYDQIQDPTWKEDLYLAPYEVPTVDLDRIFFERKLDDYHFIMYESYPQIPTVQNEITCTTNEDILTNSNRMALYPNRYIKTRPRELYNAVVGMEYHELLGSIVPVEGFTTEQVVDNIIRYPHFYCMRRIGGDGSYGNDFTPFWGQIEIDGELHNLNDVWKDLPESRIIPKTKEFMKEYQIRRYLLERDAGVKHKYPLQGDLGEFITLFMTPDMYIQLGYTDVEEMAKKCVHSRIKFHRTRNPMLRRFGVEND